MIFPVPIRTPLGVGRAFGPAPKPAYPSTLNGAATQAANIQAVYLFNENTALPATFRDTTARAAHASFTRTFAGDTFYFDRGGGAIAFQMGADGGNATSDTTVTSGLGADSVSIYCRFQIGGTNGFLSTAPGGGGGDSLYSVRTAAGRVSPTLYYDTAGFGFCADSDGMRLGARYSSAPATGQWYDLVGTYSRNLGIGTFGGTWTLYLAGAQVAQNNDTLAGSFGGTFSDAVLSVARSPSYVNAVFTSFKLLDLLFVWRRALSASDVASLLADPYQFVS